MAALFVDTSGWLAFLNDRAPRHADVRRVLADHDGRLVTTTDVWDEAIAWLSQRVDHATTVGFGEFLRTPLRVDMVDIDPSIRDAAWALFRERPDKRYSLTDCTSFVVMRKIGLETALTLDSDFRQEGFTTLP